MLLVVRTPYELISTQKTKSKIMTNVRAIAFYLPQFHPIPENNEWWGKGFTEWTNTAKAKPLFFGHYQPHVPADLGFYDLRLAETRIAQAEMAAEYGIEGFCYWHYWFAGKRLLEHPFNEVMQSGKPNFPFCLGWANDTWSGIWHGAPNRILIEQTYPGLEDYKNHFNSLLSAFTDDRYLTVDGKPIFLIYKPHKLPDPIEFTDYWRELAHQAGLKGLHFIASLQDEPAWKPEKFGFDAITIANQGKIASEMKKKAGLPKIINNLKTRYRNFLKQPVHIYDYKDALPYFIEDVSNDIEYYPCVIPNWDNTPRSGINGLALRNSTPELFREQVNKAITKASSLPDDHQIIFIKSWNEWAEGNHLEPDMKFGKGYLEIIKQELSQ
jgi:Glycosyltransferase WbsX